MKKTLQHAEDLEQGNGQHKKIPRVHKEAVAKQQLNSHDTKEEVCAWMQVVSSNVETASASSGRASTDSTKCNMEAERLERRRHS